MTPSSPTPPAPVTRLQAFAYWLKLGFISFGGPLVETSRGHLKFIAPLTAITAAVVGVILNLPVFFAGTALWPHGLGAGLVGLAVSIIPVGLLALIRYRWGCRRSSRSPNRGEWLTGQNQGGGFNGLILLGTQARRPRSRALAHGHDGQVGTASPWVPLAGRSRWLSGVEALC